ncbi:hypothetical protein V8F20_009802 [Naviculisporaceae sp. PSN 640]
MGSLALNHNDGPRCRGALAANDVSLSVDCLTPREQPEDHIPRSFLAARDPTARASSTAPEKPPELFLELDTRTLDSPISNSCVQTISPGFDFDQFSFKLPLFTNTKLAADVTSIDPSTGTNKRASTTSEKYLQQLFYTFLQSPATSTTSLVFGPCGSSDITSYFSQEQEPAMPGPTLAAPGGSGYTDMPSRDYFATPSAQEDTEPMSKTGNQSRPRSRSIEGKARRSASPIFSLWARRHQHQQQHDRSNRSSSESKPNSSSGHSFIHKRGTLSRSGSIQKRQSSQAGVVPQMTREEFEALPLAIQRKYFSTLERLRFAQDSGRVDGISQHYDDISHFRRRKARQDRSVSEQIGGRVRRQSFFEPPVSCYDSSPSDSSFPDRIKNKELTREEQVLLARRLRASVILDAADEAICKLNKRASKNLDLSRKTFDSPLSSPTESMDSRDDTQRPSNHSTTNKDIPQSFYDSFRWLEEEEDLDLRLFLDDYHANLRDNLPSPNKQQRPSFRRHLSISKIPFGRNSVSLSRPGTKDASTPISPSHSPSASASNPFGQPKRKSRALSLIAPRHAQQDSLSGFDPAAAHYQDPEARLKLRVYLASPQKFDEAIEFGFPSADVLSAAPVPGKENDRRHSRFKYLDNSANMHSFLADEDDDENDRITLNSDHASMADPDSPKTPHAFETKAGSKAPRPHRRVSTEAPNLGEIGGNMMETGGYAQAPASSREMTLRMTLTRPDLRAHEDQIYGWQQAQFQSGRKSTTVRYSGVEGGPTYMGDGLGKESMDRGAVNFDHWGPHPTDKGVMKRIWNRVRRA